jgi:D-glycero-D-manno-heptose 1,7-bisphosphate phosphatase
MQINREIGLTNLNCIFLDRDGVLNRKAPAGQYICRSEDLVVLPGVEEAIAALNASGRKVIVVTNQRGIALGLYTADDLSQIHDKLRAQLATQGGHLDAIYFCPHENGRCNCRKPLTGMFDQAYGDFPDVTPERSLMIGDTLRDIEAGIQAGMATVLISGEVTHSVDDERAKQLAHMVAGSLLEFVQGCLPPFRQ